jgi:hypothetical protein
VRVRIASMLPVDRAGTEELFAELDHVTAGDTVAHRQRHQCRLKPGTECARGHLIRELGARTLSTLRTAQALGAVLGHLDRHHRQLFDLSGLRQKDGHTFEVSVLVR